MQWTFRQWRQRMSWPGARDTGDREGTSRGSAAPRTAFLLPGGGARGAAQAGALGVLLRHGIVPDLIVGVSAGSWNGAFLARYPTADAMRELERLWIETTTRDLLGGSRVWPALNVLRRQNGVFDASGMARVAQRYIGTHTFADCVVPLRILAADLTTGEPHFFTEGRLLDAVLASSAMPGVFPPVAIGGRTFIDGGIVDWAGCLSVLAAGVQRVCLVSCGSQRLHPLSVRQSFRHIFARAMEMSNRDNFERTAFALRAAGLDVLAIHPELDESGMLDFDHAPALIAAGRRAAEVALAEREAAASTIAMPGQGAVPAHHRRPSHTPRARFTRRLAPAQAQS